MSPHHSDQMSQRSQVSGVTLLLCFSKGPSLSQWVSESVTRSPIELSAGQLKRLGLFLVKGICQKRSTNMISDGLKFKQGSGKWKHMKTQSSILSKHVNICKNAWKVSTISLCYTFVVSPGGSWYLSKASEVWLEGGVAHQLLHKPQHSLRKKEEDFLCRKRPNTQYYWFQTSNK